MFITPFPIIFLQIKVSRWHLFPWQRRRYFTLLPSTLNLSGYENSLCAFLLPSWPQWRLPSDLLSPYHGVSFLSDTTVKCGPTPSSSPSDSLFPPIVSLKWLRRWILFMASALPTWHKKMRGCREQTPCLFDFVSSKYISFGEQGGKKEKNPP